MRLQIRDWFFFPIKKAPDEVIIPQEDL